MTMGEQDEQQRFVRQLRKAESDVVEHDTGDDEEWAGRRAAVIAAAADEEAGNLVSSRTDDGPARRDPGLPGGLLPLMTTVAGTLAIGPGEGAWTTLLGIVLVGGTFGCTAVPPQKPGRWPDAPAEARGEPVPAGNRRAVTGGAVGATAARAVTAAAAFASGLRR